MRERTLRYLNRRVDIGDVILHGTVLAREELHDLEVTFLGCKYQGGPSLRV